MTTFQLVFANQLIVTTASLTLAALSLNAFANPYC